MLHKASYIYSVLPLMVLMTASFADARSVLTSAFGQSSTILARTESRRVFFEIKLDLQMSRLGITEDLRVHTPANAAIWIESHDKLSSTKVDIRLIQYAPNFHLFTPFLQETAFKVPDIPRNVELPGHSLKLPPGGVEILYAGRTMYSDADIMSSWDGQDVLLETIKRAGVISSDVIDTNILLYHLMRALLKASRKRIPPHRKSTNKFTGLLL
ncbi:hypothetical protein MMC11_006312 [Xylographa trunciseda]|nr:hypothetical protein [Xylographa trunciseda]